MASAAVRVAFAGALVATVLASASDMYWQSVGDGYCRDDACHDPSSCPLPWTTSSSCVDLEECKHACLGIEACVGIAWSANPSGDTDCWDQALPRCVVYEGGNAAPTQTMSSSASYACYARAENATGDGTARAAPGASVAARTSDPTITVLFIAALVTGFIAACTFLGTFRWALATASDDYPMDTFDYSVGVCACISPCCTGFMSCLAAAFALMADEESDHTGNPPLRALLVASSVLMAVGMGCFTMAPFVNSIIPGQEDSGGEGGSLCSRLSTTLFPAAVFLGSVGCIVAWGVQRDGLTSHLAAAWMALLALAGCTLLPIVHKDAVLRYLPWRRWLPVACLLGFGGCVIAWGVQMVDPLSWLCVASVVLLVVGLSLISSSFSRRVAMTASQDRRRMTKHVREQGQAPRMIAGKTATEWTTILPLYPCGPCSICLSAACFIVWRALSYEGTIAVGEASLASVVAIAALFMLMHGIRCFKDAPGNLADLEEAARNIDSSIEGILQAGTIRLLSCEWLLRFSDQAVPLCRRQDLPDEAFCTPDDAVRAHKEGKVFVLSYGWLTPDHPDPHGFVLGQVRRFLVSSWALPYEPLTFALFWDFTGLPQKPRSDEEECVFKAGLKDMGNLYGSLWRTVVLQLARLPEAPAGCDVEYNARPYFDRGWCNFETGAAQLAAHNRTGRSEDVLPKLIDISEEVPRPYDTNTAPRPTLEEIEDRVERATFTGKGDKKAVKEMLKDFNGFLAVGSQMATTLSRSSRMRSSRAVAPEIVGSPVSLHGQRVSAAAEVTTAQLSAADPCPNLLE